MIRKAGNFKRLAVISLVVALVATMNVGSVFAASHGFTSGKVNGLSTNYVTLDMSAGDLVPVAFTAGGNLSQAQGLSQMAKDNGCIAAINGTYFEAYNGVPVPWGVIIKNGKVLHIGNYGSTVGITSTGRLIVDNLSVDFKGYINGDHRSIPWRINHPSTEADAITIFTSEYGTTVKVAPGGLAPIVEGGVVTRIASSDFVVPAGGFAILYNPEVSHYAAERFKVGDKVTYEAEFKTKYTSPQDWKDVVTAIGAGPSLIINGQVTANGEAEGFWEAKITKNKGSRTFIGAGYDGKIKMGTIANANLQEAAAVCQSLGLVNAMCLDGGGSTSLYYNGKSITQGRNVNNGLGFVFTGTSTGGGNVSDNTNNAGGAMTVKPTSSKVLVNGTSVAFDAYEINGNNYFKLRDLAAAVNGTGKNFQVSWDDSRKAINLLAGQSYTAQGGELVKGDGKAKTATPNASMIYLDGNEIKATAYTIGGNNYFKLRDVAKVFDMGVTYDPATKNIGINTNSSYVAEY